MKKFYLYFICCLLCSLTASAQTSWNIGYPVAANVTATLSGGTLTISGTGAMEDYTNVIKPPWWEYRTDVKMVNISESVDHIGNYAFMNCEKITSVSFPNTLKSIGDNAFANCFSLSSVVFPASLYSIGGFAFAACMELSTVTIPASVAHIGINAFVMCYELREMVNLSPTPQVISNRYVFYQSSLATCTLRVPAVSVHLYGAADEWKEFGFIEAIEGTEQGGEIGSLMWYLFDGKLTISGAGDMPNYFISNYAPWDDLKEKITSVYIGEGVTSIGHYAFRYCKNLASITIPGTVKSIGEYVFSNCTSLFSIVIPGSVVTINNGAFAYCNHLGALNIPASVTSIGVYVFAGCQALTSITVDAANPAFTSLDGVLFNKDRTTIVAYPGGKGVSYTIPESVKTIGNTAFCYCNNLTSIIIPEGVATIGYSAFNNCTGLISITIPKTVTSIGFNAFNYCINMTSVTIPASAVFTGDWVFALCYGLTEIINYSTEPQTIGQNMFEGVDYNACILRVPAVSVEEYRKKEVWTEFKNIVPVDDVIWQIDEGTLIISGTGAMTNYGMADAQPWASQRNSITSVVINEGVTTIGSYAFADCAGLISISIPASLKNIYDWAFVNCSSMIFIEADARNAYYSSNDGVLFNKDKTTLIAFPFGRQGSYNIPESVEIISYGAFYRSSIDAVTISGNMLKTIYWGAFFECNSLTSINLPTSVEFIEEYAFGYCHTLSEVVNHATDPIFIQENVFYGVDVEACILRVPAASVKYYRDAQGWMQFDNILPLETEITLELDKVEIYLLTGATAEIKAKVIGSGDVEWSSSRKAIATVSKGSTESGNSGEKLITAAIGVVTAISPGTTVITASAESTEASCTVTVIEPGKSTIEGTVNNAGGSNVRVNLYMKPPESDTKKGIIGGYVLLATTVPNDNGEYSFEDLPEGSYQVEVVMDDYEPEATDELFLSGEENLTYVNFTVDVETGEIIVEIKEEEEEEEEVIKTGANELFAPDLKIYPNPFTDVVRIVGAVETWRAASLQIRVINTAGAIVHTQTIASPDETIHLGHLPAGMYIIRIENKGIAKAEKLIKFQ